MQLIFKDNKTTYISLYKSFKTINDMMKDIFLEMKYGNFCIIMDSLLS